jgi:MFS family permease
LRLSASDGQNLQPILLKGIWSCYYLRSAQRADFNKYAFIFFLAIFELGSLLCGVAQSSNMLIVGRAVAGIGGSGLLNGGLTIIRACVPNEKSPSMRKPTVVVF